MQKFQEHDSSLNANAANSNRVPEGNHPYIGDALDAGASIIVPQVETVEQAQHIVSSAKFGVGSSNGSRSVPPFRFIRGITDIPADPTKDFHKNINDQAAIVIQIESKKGVENLDAILTACPEIDLVWLVILDLRVSMDLLLGIGTARDEPIWKETVALFETSMAKHDKPRGGFAFHDAPWGSKAVVKDAVKKGWPFCMTATDILQLSLMAKQLEQTRSAIAEAMEEQKVEEMSKWKAPNLLHQWQW